MPSISPQQKEKIRAKALALGFDACGFASAGPVSQKAQDQYNDWIKDGRNSCMDYASKYSDLRANPAVLFPEGRSIISVALNYYPLRFQSEDKPQFAYYAYGRDYHEVVREKLTMLAEYIKCEYLADCRVCVDTAPIRERYWACEAGLGMIGRNNTLIIPGRGSYFFLGELICSLDINPDQPCKSSCGDCNLCVENCPTGALDVNGALDARKCLSCQLIEQRGELSSEVARTAGNRIYGCDECQKCCPHNAGAESTHIKDFFPSEEFLNLSLNDIINMDHSTFLHVFRHSAVRRAKLTGLQRNATLLKNSHNKP